MQAAAFVLWTGQLPESLLKYQALSNISFFPRNTGNFAVTRASSRLHRFCYKTGLSSCIFKAVSCAASSFFF